MQLSSCTNLFAFIFFRGKMPGSFSREIYLMRMEGKKKIAKDARKPTAIHSEKVVAI
jgi:hypothetical protein